MSVVLQLANQYFLIWIPSLVFTGAAITMFLRKVSRPWWIAWAAGLAAVSAVMFTLRTPAATLLHRGQPGQNQRTVAAAQEPVDLSSVEGIEKALITADGRPTLVEFYTDYGLG
jgi:hypothetical protein